MLHMPVHSSSKITVSTASTDHMTGLLRRSLPVRCLLIACLSVAAGRLMLMLLLPYLPSEDTAAVLVAHLPALDTPPLLYWAKLCATRFPFWFLIAIAGFTRFSGGLTSAVALYRGLCDGAAFGLLSAVEAGRRPLSLLECRTINHILMAFSVWMITDLLLRLILTLEARKIAAMEWKVHADSRMSSSAKAAIRQYVLRCLGIFIAMMAACGIYTAFLYL